MTALFDGVSGLLSDVFGASVTYLPASGDPIAVGSIFREAPIEVMGADGAPILITDPTWKLERGKISPDPARGDRIRTGDGRLWLIQSRHVTGSPASDRFLLYQLEAIL